MKLLLSVFFILAFPDYLLPYANLQKQKIFSADHRLNIKTDKDTDPFQPGYPVRTGQYSSVLQSVTLMRGDEDSEEEPALPGEKYFLMPDSAVFQTAGFAGQIAAGAGWKLTEAQELILLIGYLSKEIGGVELWQAVLKYEWHPFSDIGAGSANDNNLRISPLHLGLSAIYGRHKDLFLRLPEQYPRGYYSPTALRFTLNVGTSIKVKHLTFFMEYSALDVGADAYFREPRFFLENYNYWGLEGIGSLGFGIKVNFNV